VSRRPGDTQAFPKVAQHDRTLNTDRHQIEEPITPLSRNSPADERAWVGVSDNPAMTDGVFVLRGSGYKALVAVLVGLGTLACLIAFIEFVAQRRVGPSLELGVATAVCGAGWMRWVRAEVKAEPSGLTLRTPFRTHRLPWSQVSHADIVPSNGNRLVALVRVTTTDGRAIKADGVGCRWRREGLATTPVGHAVDVINTYVSTRR
jgi:hypothetical protein